jgi:beta-lactamase regulating signal transducer with metallopeptidase domain
MLTLPIASPLFAHVLKAGLWSALADGFREFAHAAAPVAVTALWQGALIAAGMALCMRFAPRVAAAHRFAAWAAGFGVLVALPFVPVLGRLMTLNAGAGADSNIGSASLGSLASRSLLGHAWLAHPWLQLSDRWCIAIAALWLLMALARAIDLGIHTARLRRLWKSATALRAVLPLNGSSGIGSIARETRFEVCTTRELDRPGVIGFFAPRVLIPEWLLERLTEQELEQVVLHEAEHLRRRDDWTNLLQKLCLAVFPLNPALAFIERRLCGEREMACDEGVVRRTQAPRAYAACLAGLAERHMERRAEALSLGAFERRPELARRVHSILVRRSAMHPMMSRALVGAVGCALVVGAVALARCPQLVAYVPAQPRVTVNTAGMVAAGLQPGQPDATTASHFRAINAMAIMPETRQHNGTHCRESYLKAGPHTDGARFKHTGLQQTASYRQTVVSAPAGAVAVRSETGVPEELIVLTAFEQVQSSGDVQGDRVISDYAPDSAGNARPAESSTGRIMITRLIFRIFPAQSYSAQSYPEQRPVIAQQTSARGLDAAMQPKNSAAGKPAGPALSAGSSAMPTGPSAPQAVNSLNSRFHAVPLGNGWFVIQL